MRFLGWFRKKRYEYVYLVVYFDFGQQRMFTNVQYSEKKLNIKQYPNFYGGYFNQIKLIFVYEDEYVKEEE